MKYELNVYSIVEGQLVHLKTVKHDGAFCISSERPAFYVNTDGSTVCGLGDCCIERVGRTGFYLMSTHDVVKTLIHVDCNNSVRLATESEIGLFNAGVDWAEHALPSANFMVQNFLKLGAVGVLEVIKRSTANLRVPPTAC